MRLFFTIFMAVIFLLFLVHYEVKHRRARPSMNYLISGIIIMTVFQTALNNSMGILEDISSGFMKEVLVAPISRWQIAFGQMLSSAIVAVLQGATIIVIGLIPRLRAERSISS